MTASHYAPDTLERPKDWRHYAACREEDPELFFPVGKGLEAKSQAAEAKAVCARCPVIEQCLQWAMQTRQDSGIWGGLSEDERRALKRRRRRPGRPLAACGTLTAYDRHIKCREPVDDACREAKRRASAKYRAQQKAAVP